jgi:hypothetical protein
VLCHAVLKSITRNDPEAITRMADENPEFKEYLKELNKKA